MMEKMNEALEELKRVDHLIYVSLKYTRTVDVILNILNRMVDAYSLMTDALIMFADDRKKVSTEPDSAVERAQLVRQIYGKDDMVSDNMGLYLLLRKLLRARHITRENEYRRHVTMKTVVEGREEIVNIDIITNYYLFQREFILHVKGIVDERVEVEIDKQNIEQEETPAWMRGESEPEVGVKQETTVHTTPPKKNTLKVRPVGSPPRKRAPRPKKYKIQIPKGKNSISLPYEYDPHFRKEMEKEKARLKAEEEKKKRKKATKKKTVKKKAVKKKAAKKTVKKAKKKVKKTVRKKVTKKAPKKKVKKTVKKTVRKKAKKTVKKKAVKKAVKKKAKKTVRKKTSKKKPPKSGVSRILKRVVKNVKRATGTR